MSQPATHVYEVYIRTTPEKLWDAITNGAVTPHYFFDLTLNPGPLAVGGRMQYRRTNGEVVTDGTVLEIDPPRKLVQSWFAAHKPVDERGPDSRVTWEIVPLGEACKLAVTHEHVDATTDLAKGTVEGWQIILSGLKTLLETGAPLTISWPEEAATA